MDKMRIQNGSNWQKEKGIMKTVRLRFEIGIPGNAIGFYPTFAEAACRAPLGGYVFDRMAHCGKTELWYKFAKGLIAIQLKNSSN